MSFINTMKNYFVGEDDIEQEEYEPVYSQPAEDRAVKTESEKVLNQGGTRRMRTEHGQGLQIVLARPKDFLEAKSIGDDLKAQKTVLLNLELVKSEDANRILDFLSGVAYALDDEIRMMATKTFAIMPPNVGFEGVDLMKEIENNGYNF